MKGFSQIVTLESTVWISRYKLKMYTEIGISMLQFISLLPKLFSEHNTRININALGDVVFSGTSVTAACSCPSPSTKRLKPQSNCRSKLGVSHKTPACCNWSARSIGNELKVQTLLNVWNNQANKCTYPSGHYIWTAYRATSWRTCCYRDIEFSSK